ncbi:aldo/keto reductase [Lacimicrobium sp. SS2-24]|uniref:aldo/keto reductase n=1 Tax=Lacimicrobium sp. SS2-24 TaxID=2005569 RepID=UPI000B4C03FA|nr:aldo/keto reductase [Lacimicrobium sp. SS2-24]
MQRVELVKDELSFSRCIQGYWRLHEWQMTSSELQAFVEQGLEQGITTTDHADVYGGFTEEGLFGSMLKQAPQLRERIEVVTKCGILFPCERQPQVSEKHYNSSAGYIIEAAERSLRELSTEYIDVLLLHRPDPLMDADDVARAFEALRTSGKVRHFGVSNFTASQFALLQSRLDYPLVTNQLEISLIHTDYLFDGTLDYLQQQRVRPMAWSCLGGGGVFHDFQYKALREVAKQIASHYQAELDQILLAFVLALPGQAMPILGSGDKKRIARQAAATDIALERQHWFALLEAARGIPVP